MTRPRGEVDLALSLARDGRTASQISRSIGVPRRTIVGWLRQGPPARCRRAIPSETPEEARKRVGRCPAEYAYLLGLYLGDGCISYYGTSRLPRIRLVLDAAYPGIVQEAIASIRSLVPERSVSSRQRPNENAVDVACYWRSWPDVLPQHGPGKKHERPILLALWQASICASHREALVRGLIHSDGCRIVARQKCQNGSYEYPRYCFRNRSADILGILADQLTSLAIPFTYSNAETIQIARKEAVAQMDTFIGPKS